MFKSGINHGQNNFSKYPNKYFNKYSLKQLIGTTLLSISCTNILLNTWIQPAISDPFRVNYTASNIGQNTDLAFQAMFRDGNYRQAKTYLQQAENSGERDPLIYGMLGSLAYLDEDWNALKLYADKTLEAGNQLLGQDPVRGNVYIAAGHFLQGAHTVALEGALKSSSTVMNKLQTVMSHLDKAKKINPADPELNLVKGYMDLLLAVNLPFSNPYDAIKQLEDKAKPHHLANRGIAIGYRDLNQDEQALQYVNKSLTEAPNNPELFYLKAQILTSQAKEKDDLNLRKMADENFKQALTKSDQLPRRMVAQAFFERCKNLNKIDNVKRACDPMRDAIRDGQGYWGPPNLPDL
jgi:tetratricopeptide (TPR) repeat protein